MITDVKTERWKMRSSNIISSLPRLSFESYLTNKKGDEEEDSASCPVCMDTYENEQEVIVLPCHHFFHAECSEGWLKVSTENTSCLIHALLTLTGQWIISRPSSLNNKLPGEQLMPVVQEENHLHSIRTLLPSIDLAGHWIIP